MIEFVEKYTNLMIFEPFRSQSNRKSAYVNSCLFSASTDNQSPRSRKPNYLIMGI